MPTQTRSGQRNGRHRRNLDLIALRINAGLSRDMLGLRAGVGKETIRLAECGFTPTPRVQFGIATALGKTPLELWPIETQKAAR